MSLEKYKQKRNFRKTPEPKGKVHGRRKSALRFVIQKHDASRLHYDFRLELDGVLKSWAVPKGPSLDPRRKALAVRVEDHPIEYGDFEGVIPKGEYGGGTVLLWDRGTWEPLHDPREGLENGKLRFTLHGEKLSGEWSLVQMRGKSADDGKNWLLFKVKDKFANSKSDILRSEPRSVKTNRTLEQIAGDRDDVWSGDAKQTAQLPRAEKSPLPTKFTPQLAVLADHPPAGDQWLHEIKFDGYRILGFLSSGKVKLVTRNGHDWTHRFASVAKSLESLKVDSAIIDGEVVVLDQNGQSDFQSLQNLLKKGIKKELTYFAFDMPHCNGVNLTETPLIERKRLLEEILGKSDLSPRVRYSDHIIGDGDAVTDRACRMGLEGVISKRVDAAYVQRREPTWLKSKCQQRQEFVVIGYTDPQRSRKGFGSLLLGYHDAEGRLVYAGRVGTGFDDRMLLDLHKRLAAIERDDPPTDITPPARERKHAHWVQPKLVGEVRFTGWTEDNLLRHPAFIALRNDKPAKQIVREQPIQPEDVTVMKKPDSRTKKVTTRRRPKRQSANDDEVAGVRLTHPDKVLYPEQGVTKRDVAEYYALVDKWMLPHVAHRPLALVRCPAGRAAKCFFQRNWSDTLPDSIDKVDVTERGKKKEYHIGLHDLAGIVSLAQIGVLEIHTWNCHADDVEHPDQLVFDLDPGPDVKWKQVAEGARILKSTLDALRLPTFLKTSGGKGLHVTVPIKPTVDWESAKRFCGTIVQSLAGSSKLFVANMRKDLREGKIYIDFHRNGRSATAVAPYSTRAREGAPISMPISWEELGKLPSAAHFTVETARRYLEKRKSDPWRGFDKARVDLRRTVDRRSAA